MRVVIVVVALLGVGTRAVAQDPFQPVAEQIINVWSERDVVCLGEAHGSGRAAALRRAVVQHPRFAEVVDVVVIEFANPIHQDRLDGFILDLAPLSPEELSLIWRDATSPEAWTSPVYAAFLHAIQDRNRALPRSARVRVLAGDARIDWARIRTSAELAPHLNRGRAMRETIKTVLDAGWKALAVFGSSHCVQRGRGFPGELAGDYPGRIWTVGDAVVSGADSAARHLFEIQETPAYVRVTGTAHVLLPAASFVSTRGAPPAAALGEVVDALVFHGSTPDSVVRGPRVGWDAAFEAELRRRRSLIVGIRN